MSVPPRTTIDMVKKVLRAGEVESDYDNSTDLTPFIEAASSLVDSGVPFAADKGMPWSATLQEILERWAAAHYYSKSDPLTTQRSTAKASGTFAGKPGMGGERYKEALIAMDPSGVMHALLDRLTAGVNWLGKNPSDQIDYVLRR